LIRCRRKSPLVDRSRMVRTNPRCRGGDRGRQAAKTQTPRRPRASQHRAVWPRRDDL